MSTITSQIRELEYLLNAGIINDEQKEEVSHALTYLKDLEKHDKDKEKDEKTLNIKFINKSTNKNPIYSGFDLRANKDGNLKPLGRMLVPTGLFFELPDGYELQIRPRSGLAYKNGVTVLNSPGTVDTGYRGEIKVLLINLSDSLFSWEKGERIAQGVVSPRVSSDYGKLIEVKEITESERGLGGFGSTGTK